MVFVAVAQDEVDDDKVKATEVVHEKATEWRMYSAGAPVVAFALQGELLWYATKEKVFSTSQKKAAKQEFAQLGTIPGSDVTSMVADRSGKVWIGSKNGLAVRGGSAFTCYTSANGLPDNSVNALAVAADGKVWVGTENGAAVFQGGSWTKYTTAEGLASNKVQALAIDKSGAIWFGTDKGISVYNGSSWTVHNMKKGLSWNNVKALAVDLRKSTIWAAVGEKDVNSFENGSWNTFMDIQPSISSIMVDSQSRIWFGSETGLLKFNGDEWITDSKKLGIPAAQVNQMYRDEAGNLWFAMESGVVKLGNPYPF
jgi:ligand-binding sensor domain-containing protein